MHPWGTISYDNLTLDVALIPIKIKFKIEGFCGPYIHAFRYHYEGNESLYKVGLLNESWTLDWDFSQEKGNCGMLTQ